MTSPPKTRGECANGPRPCPWESCRYHLSMRDYHCRGAALASRDKRESCALDVADQGPHFLDEIAKLFGVSRERVRQIEGAALRKMRIVLGVDLSDLLNEMASVRPDPCAECSIPKTA